MREYKPTYQSDQRSYRIRRRLGIFVMFMGVGALVITFLGWQVATMADTSNEFALPFLGSIAGVFIGVMLSVVILVFLNPWMEEEDWQ